MKNFVLFFFISLLSLFPNQVVSAESSVNIENNGEGATSDVHVDNSVGQSTTCVNGNCSTLRQAQGNNTTTVCINGKCSTSQDGNVDRQEGGAKVKIENHSMPSITVAPPPKVSVTPPPKPKVTPPAHQQKAAAKSMSLEQMISNFRNFVVSWIHNGR